MRIVTEFNISVIVVTKMSNLYVSSWCSAQDA